jgi:hypothetical protein
MTREQAVEQIVYHLENEEVSSDQLRQVYEIILMEDLELDED